MLINKTIPVTPYDVSLTFRDTNKKFQLQGIVLKMITNKKYNVNLANLLDQNLMFEFAKEMSFDEKTFAS